MTLYYKHGDGGRIADLLAREPVELYFIGASVTAQRDGWADRLLQLAREATGQAHTTRRNAMGGIGLLFGVSNHALVERAQGPRVAFIEFSTGDLNLGLTPIEHLGRWLTELVSFLAAEGTPVVFVHNWRGDFDIDDRGNIRRHHDEVAARHGIPVIENHRMAAAALADGRAEQAAWFRDVCHTVPAGADAYARHVLDCLVAMRGEAGAAGAALPPPPVDRIRPYELAPELVPAQAAQGRYVYPLTKQSFPVVTLEASTPLTLRASGRLTGVAMISGPRACWVLLHIDGVQVRRFRVFDRNSHYERYVLLPAVFALDNSLLTLRCDEEPVDFSLSSQPHQDFTLPRQLRFVHWVGAGLSFTPDERASP